MTTEEKLREKVLASIANHVASASQTTDLDKIAYAFECIRDLAGAMCGYNDSLHRYLVQAIEDEG